MVEGGEMSGLEARWGDHCEMEKIHALGAIQPHAALACLSVDDGSVLAASVNFPEMFPALWRGLRHPLALPPRTRDQ